MPQEFSRFALTSLDLLATRLTKVKYQLLTFHEHLRAPTLAPRVNIHEAFSLSPEIFTSFTGRPRRKTRGGIMQGQKLAAEGGKAGLAAHSLASTAAMGEHRASPLGWSQTPVAQTPRNLRPVFNQSGDILFPYSYNQNSAA